MKLIGVFESIQMEHAVKQKQKIKHGAEFRNSYASSIRNSFPFHIKTIKTTKNTRLVYLDYYSF